MNALAHSASPNWSNQFSKTTLVLHVQTTTTKIDKQTVSTFEREHEHVCLYDEVFSSPMDQKIAIRIKLKSQFTGFHES